MAKKLTKKRKAEIMFSDAYVTITSREIAEMTGKEHKNVLRDIDNIVEETGMVEQKVLISSKMSRPSVIGTFYNTTYKDKQKKNRRMIVMGERFGMVLLAGYSSKYRLDIVDELLERRKAAHQWHESRENLRSEHWELTSHIERLSTPNEEGEVRRDENGKRLAMRYSTELDMMNKIVLGMNAKKFKLAHGVENIRDALSPTRILILEKIQKHNILFLEVDKGYYERQALLVANYYVLCQRYQSQLIEELQAGELE